MFGFQGQVPSGHYGITYCYQRHEFPVQISPPRVCRKQEMQVREQINATKKKKSCNFLITEVKQ
jgi:hypothetical protein